MTNLAYLSLGSNIDPEENLPKAVRLLGKQGKILAISTVWETTPVGFLEQPNFLNAALILETPVSAEFLRQNILRAIEHALQRVRTANRNAPRTIDIDLSLFNDEVLTLGSHQIPDPDILTRAFIAIPLAEIAPDYIHPLTGQRLREIAAGFSISRQEMIPRADVKPGQFVTTGRETP